MAAARCSAALLMLSVLVGCAIADDAIDWRDAHRCGGWLCTISGTVVASKDEGPVIRLYFDSEDHSAYVTLVKGWLVTWPDYVGRRVAAEGRLRHFHGDTEILVGDPSDIEVLDRTPAPATPTAAPPPAQPAATPEAVERLRERVRELEDRMRQLEERPAN